MAYWRLRLKLLSTARSIPVISCFITGVHLAQRVPRRQSIDKDRKRTQVTEMMGKGLRDGQNHGVEESWRKLKRSHRWWVRWTRLLRSRGGPTLISARLFSVPLPLHFRGLRFRKAVRWKRDCVSRKYGERGARKSRDESLVLEEVPSVECGEKPFEMRWRETEDGFLSATFHLAGKFSNWAASPKPD